MSLWTCIEHGLTGPMACCRKANLASLSAVTQAWTAVTQACSKGEIDAKDARIAALEARCREMEKECDDADFMDARIADLERQLSQYKEAFHKAFNQFENITVSDTLAVVKERAHQMIGWAYTVLPDYALETKGEQG